MSNWNHHTNLQPSSPFQKFQGSCWTHILIEHKQYRAMEIDFERSVQLTKKNTEPERCSLQEKVEGQLKPCSRQWSTLALFRIQNWTDKKRQICSFPPPFFHRLIGKAIKGQCPSLTKCQNPKQSFPFTWFFPWKFYLRYPDEHDAQTLSTVVSSHHVNFGCSGNTSLKVGSGTSFPATRIDEEDVRSWRKRFIKI